MTPETKLKKALENLSWHKDTDTIFKEIYEAVEDYIRETKNYAIESIFEDYIHIETANQIAKDYIDIDDLFAVRKYSGDAESGFDYYKTSPYGYLENIDDSDLENIVENIKYHLKQNKKINKGAEK